MTDHRSEAPGRRAEDFQCKGKECPEVRLLTEDVREIKEVVVQKFKNAEDNWNLKFQWLIWIFGGCFAAISTGVVVLWDMNGKVGQVLESKSTIENAIRDGRDERVLIRERINDSLADLRDDLPGMIDNAVIHILKDIGVTNGSDRRTPGN